ncbi:MAG: CAAX prenyl protease-related protein [Planctomycetota bacterium]|nr:CAAX prenyl protease-related protein [Planctomycetota bacterium]
MANNAAEHENQTSGYSADPTDRGTGWLNNPWVIYLGPFIVFMLLGSLEPSPPLTKGEPAATGWFGIEYGHYPIVYSIKILLVALAVAAVWKNYPRFRAISPLAWLVGIGGAVAWIALAHGQRWVEEASGLAPTLDGYLGGRRAGFNPLLHLADMPVAAWGFLAVRFIGLAVLVPIIEEMFLRGFIMRFPAANEWWKVPLGKADRVGIIAAIAVPVLMHPYEAVAAIVWFGAMAWMFVRTKNVWDCVLAHAITNLLLGIYVVTQDQWWLM